MKLQKNKILFTTLCFSYLFTACKGQKSTKPPILPIQNMVEQTSYAPQSPDDFFADKRSTREPLPNVVAEGEAYNDSRFDRGQEPTTLNNNVQWVQKFPIKLNMNLLKDGQKNFNIYCAPCHGISGHNDGLVTQRSGGSIRPTNIHDTAIQEMPVGQIYSAVTNGVNNWNMPGFKAQLDTIERWAVVSYIRALQISEEKPQTETEKNVSLKKGDEK